MSRDLLRKYISEIIVNALPQAKGGAKASNNFRGGIALSPEHNRSLADDEDDEVSRDKQNSDAMPHAACVLITADDGKVLAVSRKDDPSDFGLPGGKVDSGEDTVTAAARELQEETGLIAKTLTPVFCSTDSEGFVVTTYAAEVEGEIDTQESGAVRWVDLQVLLQGSFGDYNKALFKQLDRLK